MITIYHTNPHYRGIVNNRLQPLHERVVERRGRKFRESESEDLLTTLIGERWVPLLHCPPLFPIDKHLVREFKGDVVAALGVGGERVALLARGQGAIDLARAFDFDLELDLYLAISMPLPRTLFLCLSLPRP